MKKSGRWMMLAALMLPAMVVMAGQISDICGTSESAFDIGIGASKVTLTNSAGTLSIANAVSLGSTVTLTSGLTVNSGTINFTGASANTTKVTGLNADQTDGISLTAGSDGGLVYQTSSSGLTAASAGTSGQLLRSGGSGAPTWSGLTSGYVLVGNGSNIPTGVALSGDATITNAGVMTIANSAVTATKINNGTITTAKVDSTFEDLVIKLSASPSAEFSNVITVTTTIQDANGNSLSGLRLCAITISDSATALSVTAQSPTLGYTTGAQWTSITANKKDWAYTSSGGSLVFTVTLAGDLTVYAHVTCGAAISTATCDFN